VKGSRRDPSTPQSRPSPRKQATKEEPRPRLAHREERLGDPKSGLPPPPPPSYEPTSSSINIAPSKGAGISGPAYVIRLRRGLLMNQKIKKKVSH
jgi:hypothetical protein